ncbi:MAG: tetratricopeptide repeat protein [Ignavibacteria bacterium]|mgnify:CR=1 FL=1|nr:tetratricopeptide repeat protein [Ignavibacteria bacterium]
MDLTVLLTILGIIATIAAPAAGYILKLRKEYKNCYSVLWKSSAKLKAKDLLGERPYEDYYYERSIDQHLFRSIERNRNTLILGPPLSGKTRAVFNTLKSLKKPVRVLVPRSVQMSTFIFPKDFSFRRQHLVFIDDLQYYIEKQDTYPQLFREAKERGIPIVATCHTGREFKKVRNKMVEQNMDIDIIFGEDIIELDKISSEEGRLVAGKLGLKWDTVKFNGTIGSIFMRLSEMERRFDSCDTVEKTILRVLRNLYKSGIYEESSHFRIDWIKKAASMFELEGRDFEWTGWLKSLEDKEFAKIARRNKLWAEDAYLEFVVKPEVEISQLEIIESMIEVFSADAEVLEMAGERAYDLGTVDTHIADYMNLVIMCFEKVLQLIGSEIKGALYLKSLNYLGLAYWSLSAVQDAFSNSTKAIDCFNEVLKLTNADSQPYETAKIKNKLGNAYIILAQLENIEANCVKAIEAYDSALKVFSQRKFPLDFSRTKNNLGGAYLLMAKVKDSADNYRSAIQCFAEAIKVTTAEENSKFFALTKNNIANTYARLSELEDAETNLLQAIDAYNDVLKIQTIEKAPLQYGLTMNNIGNAYSMLAMIKDKKANIDKAIYCFEEALKVRLPEQVPLQYANTMFNMGDAYLALGTSENNPDLIARSIDHMEESKKLRTAADYPLQYAEVCTGIGRAYIKLAEFEDKTENYHKAIAAFDEALKVYTEKDFPDDHAFIMEEISKAKKIFF